MLMFHGTAATYVRSILAKGLIPGVKPGADQYAHDVLGWGVIKNRKKREPSVFITPDKSIALWYAMIAAKQIHDHDEAVFKLEIPEEAKAKLLRDERGAEDDDGPEEVAKWGYRVPQVIPPAWIKGLVAKAELDKLKPTLPGLPEPDIMDRLMMAIADPSDFA